MSFSGHVGSRPTKAGVSWYYMIELGRDPSTGERKRRTGRGFASKKEAETALRRGLTDLESGANVDRTVMTVAEFLNGDWLSAHRQQIRPNTLDAYRSAIQRHIVPHIGAIRLQQLSPRDVNRLYALLAERGSQTGGPLAPKTVRNTHVVLLRALADAVRWELIRRNPAAAASPPSAARRPRVPEPWRPHEVRTFLESVVGDEWEALWVLAATTGMRRSEILGLRWSDVNLTRARLSVVQTVVPVGGTPEVGAPKTKRSARQVHLDTTATAGLRARRRRLPVDLPDEALVFARSDGSPLRPGTVTNRFQRLRQRADLRHIRFHDLRHTWATLALEAGINPKVVSEQLGHANISITLDTYSHVIPALQADAVDRVADAIYNASDDPPVEPPRLQVVPSG